MRPASIALATLIVAASTTAAQDAPQPIAAAPASASVSLFASPRIAAPLPAVAASTGPSIAKVGVAYAPVARGAIAPAPQRRTAQQRRGTTYMIVGGAMLIGGLVIGDDAGTIVALGGLGIGIYGLYLYVQ